MHILIRLLALLALILGLPACGSDRTPSSNFGYASEAELDWVRRYTAWAEGFQAGWGRAGVIQADVLAGHRPRNDLRSAYAPLQSCARTLSEDVGVPPTARLRLAGTLMRQACASFGAAVEIELDGLGGDPGAVSLEAEAQWQKASQLWYLSSKRLRALLGDGRVLPVRAARMHGSHIDPRFARAAGALTHDTVEVRCWSRRDWTQVKAMLAALDPNDYVDFNGVASPDERRVSLAPRVCSWLAELAYSEDPPRSDRGVFQVADAVLTLAHEAVHLRAPAASEAETECFAVQEVRRTAQALGATPAYAEQLARVVWNEIYPLNDALYSTTACRDGGPLDMHPERRAWP
jgi:hypothetical protein